MKQRLMVTTLFSGDNVSDKTYYFCKNKDGKALYCDALMPAEAACKYMLSSYQIDEIIVIGAESLNISEPETKPVVLREGQSFYASDLKQLSRYDLLRYRLAEFVDELQVEAQDKSILLSDDEQERTVAFLRTFFSSHLDAEDNRPNRYFHLLAQDRGLFEALRHDLLAWVPESEHARYIAWVGHYLYQDLKETSKMELSEANTDVRIRFVSVKEDDSLPFLKRMRDTFNRSDDPSMKDGVDIYLCLQNSEAAVVMDIYNLVNLTKIMRYDRVQVCKTITATCRPDTFADEISDSTSTQSLSELMAGAAAFLDYGKTDSIVRFWEQSGIENPRIDQIIYALRNIDNGISLCDIGDIERGIRSLRAVLADKTPIEGDTPVEQMFDILQESIRRDYGRLLETEQIEFIDLVRWAYRKEFWQQTLTLIESRAPRDFIEHGYYYYCDSEDNLEQVTKLFGQEYYDLRPFEKYKMNDIPHYYIKFYNRQKANHQLHGKEYIQSYATVRSEELDTQDPGEIRAYTLCPDRSAVKNLLFAYYYVGDVRNATNHAQDYVDCFSEIKEDSDSSERMELIRQSIEYFLFCYQKVARLTDGKASNVVQVSADDIHKYANELREQNNRNRGR